MNLHEYPALGERCWTTTLENGLRILVVPKPGFAKSYAMLAADYGSMDMSYTLGGRRYAAPAGVAHYLEHKMFDLPGENVMDAFTRRGASPNAFTSYGVTAYHFDGTEGFYENLELLLRYVSTPYFTQESVEKERGIIGQEIAMYDDNPGSALSENLHQAMYRSHPVRVPILGTVDTIAQITPDTLYQCHSAFYTPGNMLLIAVGDLDPERVAQTAQRMLPQTRAEKPQKDYGPPEPETVEQPRVQAAMDVSMPMFAAGFKCTPQPSGPQSLREMLLGALASDVLAGESSDLYLRLYRQGLVDDSLSAGYSKLPGTALFAVSGDSRDPDAVLQAVLEEARRIGENGISEDRFRRLKRSALGQRLRNLDSFEALSYYLLDACLEGADFFTFPEVYQTLTQQDVSGFLRENLTRERCALSVVVPKA